jgi:hypothetical protein
MPFVISGLDPKHFDHLRGRSDEELAKHNAARLTVDGHGFPDRVSLVDLPAGDTVLLLNFEHQPANSPYRSSHAIFVSERAAQAATYRNDVPQALRDRMLSLRAFNDAGDMRDAALVDGKEVEPVIERMFGDPAVAYIHVHNAARGCYAARIDRGPSTSSG